MERYWHILWAACGILGVILIFVIVTLLQGDTISYTDTADVKDITRPQVNNANPTKGDQSDPLVTIVEYCQFGSTGCQSMAKELDEVLRAFPEEVRIVWKDFPNTDLVPEALSAATAARCAQDQGLFWEFHDALFETQIALNDDAYLALAKELELSERSFKSCLKKQQGLPLVQMDIAEAKILQVVGTPTLYVNDARIGGTLKGSDLITRVQQALTTASTTN